MSETQETEQLEQVEETSPKKQFNFLDDKPTTNDQFGSHQAIAENIVQQIKYRKEGLSIGLEGGWGSGKSSVIKILEDKLHSESEITVFTFDAWAHEGDSLRRSFLEELINHLRNEQVKWLEKKEGCKKIDIICDARCPDYENKKCRPDSIRDELKNRKEDIVITTEPTTSFWGIIFAVTALAMPIGVALISTNPKTFLLNLIYTLIAALPLISVLIYFSCGKGRKRNSTEDDKSELLAEFIKTRETTHTTARRSIDPTSIEFRELYYEILKLTFENNNERKIIIVLDNLDRIENDEAKKAWATMRTFLRSGRKNSDPKDLRDRVWLIVPYDPDAIEELWETKSKYPDNLGTAFKEKTFQTRYHVAPPLVSKWEGYFKAKLKDTFGNQISTHSIYHIFKKICVETTPTPRECVRRIHGEVYAAFLCCFQYLFHWPA